MRFFTREDLGKPENRVNVALFGALGVPEVHAWLTAALDLPSDVALVPLSNDGPRRPDLWAVDPEDRKIAPIEIELARDAGQVDDYAAAFPTHQLRTIWGLRRDGGTTSLEDLSEALGTMRPQTHQQQRQVWFLKTLIDEALRGYRRGSKREHVSDEVRASPLVAALIERLGDRIDFVAGDRVEPGRIGATTNGRQGLSLRGASPVAKGGSVALLSITHGREVATVQARDHLLRYLPEHDAAVEAWLTFLTPLCRRSRARDTTVPVVALVERVDEVAGHLAALSEKRVVRPA